MANFYWSLHPPANCGPPPSGEGVSPAPSSPPYGVDESGILIANPGAVATYTCVDPNNVENFMGEADLVCSFNEDNTTVAWDPELAPMCIGMMVSCMAMSIKNMNWKVALYCFTCIERPGMSRSSFSWGRSRNHVHPPLLIIPTYVFEYCRGLGCTFSH